MKKSKSLMKELNHLLNNGDLNIDAKATLLEIKKSIEYGEINYTEGFKNSMLLSFYKDYIDDISVWLHEPPKIIINKIKENMLTEVESKLILTNILIKIKESKETENESVY